jgi:poly-gamma-glutamate synthesis protein (capsule biosynthesis protein)
MHHHEYGATARDVAEHIEVLAHEVIDAGADIFVGHGPHEDRGIEIYRGKPILYSLGDFIMQNDTVTPQPQRSYDLLDLGPDATPSDFYDARSMNGARGPVTEPAKWESFVAMVSFRAGRLDGLTLHPVDLGFGRPRHTLGRPVLAEGAVAASVLQRLGEMSRPYGTRISIDGNIGSVRL